MRLLVIAALVPLSASFGSVPKGLVLIRDSFQFEGNDHPMTGFTPDGGGPHKLIVMLTGLERVEATTPHDKAFEARRGALENIVATQGHGVVKVEVPGFTSYPDDAGAAGFFSGNLSLARGKVCADWVRKATGVVVGIEKLCARGDFDCSSGLALAGISMGAGVAVTLRYPNPGPNPSLNPNPNPRPRPNNLTLIVTLALILTATPTLPLYRNQVQISKIYGNVNALLTTQWAPLIGAGQPVFQALNGPEGGLYLLPPHPLALHFCGFDDTANDPPTWSTVGNLASVPADQYPPALSTFVDKTKRLSLISAQDNYYGNPTEDAAAAAPLFSLQRDFSGYDHCPDTQYDCTQADGSGYYVVPAGVIPPVPGMNMHRAFGAAFVDDAFIGEKWHAAAAFKFLGDAAFGG